MKYFILFIISLFSFGVLRAQPMDDHAFLQQYQLARVYDETHDFTNALRIYEALHKARPNAGDVSESLFRLLYYLKKYDEADTVITERIAHEKENFELYLNQARVRAKLNRKSEAIESFNKALETPTPVYGNLGVVPVVAQAMIEMGYEEDALNMLIKQRSENPGQYTDQIASLYFKLGKFDEGTKEYIAMLRESPDMLSLVEQRIAYFTADTNVRRTIIRTVTSHINIETASPAELRLMGWCDGELKNYREALQIFLKLDNLGIENSSKSSGGYELYNFAERIRREGAYDVASLAYTEAIKRFHEGAANDPSRRAFVAMAELGSLETKEAYLLSLPEIPLDSLQMLVSNYRTFAASQPNDLAFEAMLHAGDLALHRLRNFAMAQSIYENLLSHTRSYSERSREAEFALEEIALAQGDLHSAQVRLDNISVILSKRNRPEDEETKKRILLERARIDFYNGSFDTSLVKLDSIIADPNSDYANDAISLHSLITENRSNQPALKSFARAELASLGSDLNAALSAYKSIPETYPNAPINDESFLRAAELLVQLKKPADAIAMLETMPEKMPKSTLLDRAVYREAEITDAIMKDKAKALRMYEDFLERYSKSPLTIEARKRARTLRGDTF